MLIQKSGSCFSSMFSLICVVYCNRKCWKDSAGQAECVISVTELTFWVQDHISELGRREKLISNHRKVKEKIDRTSTLSQVTARDAANVLSTFPVSGTQTILLVEAVNLLALFTIQCIAFSIHNAISCILEIPNQATALQSTCILYSEATLSFLLPKQLSLSISERAMSSICDIGSVFLLSRSCRPVFCHPHIYFVNGLILTGLISQLVMIKPPRFPSPTAPLTFFPKELFYSISQDSLEFAQSEIFPLHPTPTLPAT